jgi:hypothetical protein
LKIRAVPLDDTVHKLHYRYTRVCSTTLFFKAKRKMRYKRTVERIGRKLRRWFRVERKYSVIIDGTMSWIPVLAEQVGVRVNGQQPKTAS